MARSTLPESGEGLRVIHSASQAVASPSPQESPTAPIDAQQVHRSEEPDALVAHVRIGIDPVLWTQMPLQIRRVKGCPHVKKTSSVGQVPGCGVKAMILSKMGGIVCDNWNGPWRRLFFKVRCFYTILRDTTRSGVDDHLLAFWAPA
jgi:hypothetical protein